MDDVVGDANPLQHTASDSSKRKAPAPDPEVPTRRALQPEPAAVLFEPPPTGSASPPGENTVSIVPLRIFATPLKDLTANNGEF